ncbi:hypothetical protein E4U42_001572, partial [Claviceps africana]
MARTLPYLASLLAARHALVLAKPVPDERPAPTLDVRPVRVLTEVAVSLSTSFAKPTDIVFCQGETLHITEAGFISTVATFTRTENVTASTYAPCGNPVTFSLAKPAPITLTSATQTQPNTC